MSAPILPLAPEALARYRLVEEVGQGGMAVVWRAMDTSLEREVAVKLLHPHLAQKPESRQRFSREARAVARLRHPNLLEIFDFSGEGSASAYIVTEFIRGGTLRKLVDAYPLPLPELGAMIVSILAHALEHAHAQGIVHRDLKPENVMVREDGVLKLTDFGIAKLLDRDENMTATGALLGSPAHMAPEVIDGKEADQRSDIFSLGTILYWLCAGRMPFMAPSPGALLKMISDGRYEDPRAVNPAVSDKLASVIARCLATDPAMRPSSAEALQKELDETLVDAGLPEWKAALAAWLRAPDDASSLRQQVVDHLALRGAERLRKRKFAQALSDLNRVLALSPGHEQARALLRKARRRSRRRIVLYSALGCSVLVTGVSFAMRLWPEPAPVPAVPIERPRGTIVAERTPVPVPEPEPAPAPVAIAKPPPRPAAPTAPGTLEVNVQPWARVLVDGVEKAASTPATISLSPGKHSVVLEHPSCCPPMEETVEIVSGETRPLRKRLEPKDAFLLVKGPPETRVWLDGLESTIAKTGGSFPVPMLEDQSGAPLYTRKIQVRVAVPGQEEVARELEFRAGEQKPWEAP